MVGTKKCPAADGRRRWSLRAGVLAVALAAPDCAAEEPEEPAIAEWPVYGGDQAATKYSPLDEINRDTVQRLEIAWEWRPNEVPHAEYGTRPGKFQNTPLMIDNILYVSTPYNRVVALDAETGEERWAYDPEAYVDGQPASGQGFVHRGLAAWRDGEQLRIFLNTRHRLICLDAATGAPVQSFGTDGAVDLGEGLVWEIDRTHYASTSPPVIYEDLVILGNGVGDRLMYRNDPPGDVRAFDARTGEQVWSFHTIPQEGEFGNETWEDDSWRFTGHTNVWAPMSLDEERGLLYLPVGTPSNDYYGGRRKGDNLFAESLVCLDAATGERRWHYQFVHHGLWDYDLPAAPNLVSITVGDRQIDAVAQVTKMGFTFVFDRVTGDPVWPIEERPVPQSDVPGERTAATQPFPSRPPPFADQGVTLDDAFDLSPELQAAVQHELQQYRLGGLYTPPSMEGTVVRPGVWGGANWGGAAFDSETGHLYLKTVSSVRISRIQKFDREAATPRRAAEVDAEYVSRGRSISVDDVPLFKPPYAHLVAIDLNEGAIAWRVPFGDDPSLRQILERKGLPVPEKLGVAGPPGAIVTGGGLIFIGGGDLALHAVDKTTGGDVWSLRLPRETTGTPMTYRARSGRQFIALATGGGEDAALVAFALAAPGESPASP